MTSSYLRRHAPKEPVTVEPFDAIDDEGVASYGAGVEIQATVEEIDDVTIDEGEEVRTTHQVFVDGSEPLLPDRRARLTFADGDVGIVVERTAPLARDGSIDHVFVRTREA